MKPGRMSYPHWATLEDKWTMFGAECLYQQFQSQWSAEQSEAFDLLGEAFYCNRPVVVPMIERLPEPWRTEALALVDDAKTSQEFARALAERAK